MLVTMGKYLMGAGEIRDRLGVSRQRVQQIIAKPDFPAPYDEVQMGKVWRITDVEAWIALNRPDLVGEPIPTVTPVRRGNRNEPPNKKRRVAEPDESHDSASGT